MNKPRNLENVLIAALPSSKFLAFRKEFGDGTKKLEGIETESNRSNNAYGDSTKRLQGIDTYPEVLIAALPSSKYTVFKTEVGTSTKRLKGAKAENNTIKTGNGDTVQPTVTLAGAPVNVVTLSNKEFIFSRSLHYDADAFKDGRLETTGKDKIVYGIILNKGGHYSLFTPKKGNTIDMQEENSLVVFHKIERLGACSLDALSYFWTGKVNDGERLYDAIPKGKELNVTVEGLFVQTINFPKETYDTFKTYWYSDNEKLGKLTNVTNLLNCKVITDAWDALGKKVERPQSRIRIVKMAPNLDFKDETEYSLKQVFSQFLGYPWPKSSISSPTKTVGDGTVPEAGPDDAEAIYLRALQIEEGVGVPQNLEEAARLFELAANKGFAKAQFKLGKCYYTGAGVKENDEKAAIWYEKAADQGDEKAQIEIARFYEKGIGVNESIEEAKKYYELAAQQGNEDARKRLNELETPKETPNTPDSDSDSESSEAGSGDDEFYSDTGSDSDPDSESSEAGSDTDSSASDSDSGSYFSNQFD